MIENDYLEQAGKDRLELEKHRLNYMADDTPIEPSDIPKLMEIAQKLQAEDTSLNIYELYKHPEARAKLFSQVAEACYMTLNLSPTQAQRLAFCNYLEQQYENSLKKMIANTDKQALGELLDLLELPEETEKQFIRDMAVSGLLAKD
ncbi:TPA: hypothetical protein U1B15_000634 [Streptococcus suis]|uniref:hypothetical protein n=1 Tax=Streptococcus suis TaxID=1307 RepID=UPI0003F528AD|nr:hypothetical protein [Streptococcus suis]QZS51852.1 hypothetical protein K6976_03390 [Streptococcus suis]HEM3428042.1 hypothetical protein [Streptococcus suis]HEM3450574.1 hypothetical protein [Streptococcus suis]HEM3498195.1 hypothetical protein [Streptococcus suis]HEM3521472.1 hypothetical protein [Streptococcus suis]